MFLQPVEKDDRLSYKAAFDLVSGDQRKIAIGLKYDDKCQFLIDMDPVDFTAFLNVTNKIREQILARVGRGEFPTLPQPDIEDIHIRVLTDDPSEDDNSLKTLDARKDYGLEAVAELFKTNPDKIRFIRIDHALYSAECSINNSEYSHGCAVIQSSLVLEAEMACFIDELAKEKEPSIQAITDFYKREPRISITPAARPV